MGAVNEVDYKSLYEGYWQSKDRVGERSGDLARIATLVAETCGYGNAIDIGCGEGFMVGELLNRGIDAVGLDISAVVVERAKQRWPGRFYQGSVLSLPFEDNQFDVVVSTDCMEHLASPDVPFALREIYRVSRRYVFLQIATTHDRDGHWHLTVEGREWWEARCFEAGFRKHALYYHANPYEALNSDDWQILVLLEKVPEVALRKYALESLDEERLLHTDMLREVGRRSDAHCIRYCKAAEYIRPGDRVLDVACGLGYGSHILYTASQAVSVIGVDLSEFGVAYANAHYGREKTVEFVVGDAQNLAFIPDNSVDFVTAFETIEHVPDPLAYLSELKRVLKPAGRVMVCAPNNWADETGKDPNPHHLHVYTWERLIAECSKHFLLEKGFLQTAGGAMKCHHSARSWKTVSIDSVPQEESEWALLLCMADPLAAENVPYSETVWKLPQSHDFHVSAFARDYENPWIVKGMVAIGFRAQSSSLLSDMQKRVLASSDPNSVDFGAALCGHIYLLMQSAEVTSKAYEHFSLDIRRYAAIKDPTPHQLRWQVSLLYAGGELARCQGRSDEAEQFYRECADHDVVFYSPLLGNKVIDALHQLAVLSLSRRDLSAAKNYLLRIVAEVQKLVSGDWLNIIGDKIAPLPFGFAETSQLLDKAARAAYLLSVIDGLEYRPGLLFRESRGFFERQILERDFLLGQKNKAIDNLLSVLAQTQSACHHLEVEVTSLSARTQELASEVVNQDAHAQSLAREVALKDQEAQKLAIELVQSREEVSRLKSIINEQDVIAEYFRPQMWLKILRKILRKSST